MDETEKDIATFVIEAKFDMKTKKLVSQRATLNGLRQDLPDGTPAEIRYDEQGRELYRGRFDHDEYHCEFEGAIIRINPENGIRYSEGFFYKGQPYPQELGPRHITRNKETGKQIGQTYDERKTMSEFDYENLSPDLEP